MRGRVGQAYKSSNTECSMHDHEERESNSKVLEMCLEQELNACEKPMFEGLRNVSLMGLPGMLG